MKRLAFLLLLAWPVFAQTSSTGNITAGGSTCAVTNACIVLNLPNDYGGATITLSGTFSGTLQFEGSGDSIHYASLSATPLAGGSAVTSATAAGTWQVSSVGLQVIRVRCSTYTSGTVIVTIQASKAGIFAATSGSSGSMAFSSLTSGTNTSAAMVVGSGASLATSGTGTIAATSLTDAISSDLVDYTSPATGGYLRLLTSKLTDQVSAMDFGAIGAGTTNPVSGWCTNHGGTRFTAASDGACLTAIQTPYPFITAITQQIDYAALQACINWASTSQIVCNIGPAAGATSANYYITTVLDVPSNTSIKGQGYAFGTQITPVGNVPCMQLNGPGHGGNVFRVTLEDFTCDMVSSTYAGKEIDMEDVYQVDLHRVYVQTVPDNNSAVGIFIQSSNSVILDHVVVYGPVSRANNPTGIWVDGTTTASVQIDLYGTDIENFFYGIYVNSAVTLDTFGGYFEGNISNIYVNASTLTAVTVSGGTYPSVNSSTYAMEDAGTASAGTLTIHGAHLPVGASGGIIFGPWNGDYELSQTGGAYASVYSVTGPLLVAGLLDGEVPVTLTTGASCTLGTASGCNSTAYNSGYTFNQEATAATAITYTLPTAAAGKQYCVANSNNGSAADTGTLELLTSASGQYIIFTDGTLSASGGYVISGGAAADAACVIGLSSTQWQLYVQSGTWAKH